MHGNPLFLRYRAGHGHFLSMASKSESTAKSGREYLSMYSQPCCRAVNCFYFFFLTEGRGVGNWLTSAEIVAFTGGRLGSTIPCDTFTVPIPCAT